MSAPATASRSRDPDAMRLGSLRHELECLALYAMIDARRRRDNPERAWRAAREFAAAGELGGRDHA